MGELLARFVWTQLISRVTRQYLFPGLITRSLPCVYDLSIHDANRGRARASLAGACCQQSAAKRLCAGLYGCLLLITGRHNCEDGKCNKGPLYQSKHDVYPVCPYGIRIVSFPNEREMNNGIGDG